MAKNLLKEKKTNLLEIFCFVNNKKKKEKLKN
jgi:hypothetical protein